MLQRLAWPAPTVTVLLLLLHVILRLVCIQSKCGYSCPAKSHCTCRNQGSVFLQAESDSITSVMFRMAKWLTVDLWVLACLENGKE